MNLTPVGMSSNDQVVPLVDVNTNYHIVLSTYNGETWNHSAYCVFTGNGYIGGGGNGDPGWLIIDYNTDMFFSSIRFVTTAGVTISIYNTTGSKTAVLYGGSSNGADTVVYRNFEQVVGSRIWIYFGYNPHATKPLSMKELQIYGDLLPYSGFIAKPADLIYGYV